MMRLRDLTPRPAIRRRREAWRPAALVDQLETHAYSDAIYEALFHARLDPHYLVSHPLGAGSVVVDVGAFVGYFGEAVADRTGAAVYCFEANPNAARLIRPDLRVFPFGLGPVDRPTTMALHGQRSRIDAADVGFGEIEVRVRCAADVFNELGITHIDLLKVDAPGAELDLLDHLITEGWLPRVDRLLLHFPADTPGAAARYRSIRSAITTTHHCSFRHAGVWEQWERKP